MTMKFMHTTYCMHVHIGDAGSSNAESDVLPTGDGVLIIDEVKVQHS